MWPDRYDTNSFFYPFHTCHPTIEQKMVLGTLLDCLQYHYKVRVDVCRRRALLALYSTRTNYLTLKISNCRLVRLWLD